MPSMHPTRRDFLKAVGAAPAAALASRRQEQRQAFPPSASQTGSPRLPNIVIFMTDQQQARCSAREGFPLDTTPFMDEAAREGTWFDRAYTGAAECVPTRRRGA